MVMKMIYKYCSPDILDLIFAKSGLVRLRCTYPRDFNDPFELFLTIDTRKLPRKYFAFYNEVLGQIPLLPTTCFSHRPDIIPMWAHYGLNSTGFVLEIDENRLQKSFPDGKVEKVNYDTTPFTITKNDLAYAYEIAKPRHTYFLLQDAINNDYLRKNACWSYEEERRLVVTKKDVVNENGLMILEVPAGCVRAIISGSSSSDTIVEHCIGLCKKYDYQHYQMRLGRGSLTPFFIASRFKYRRGKAARKHTSKSTSGSTYSYVFKKNAFERVNYRCALCGEPIRTRSTAKCNWCSLTKAQAQKAAVRNPFRMLEQLGMLESYIEMHNRVSKKK